MVFGKKKKEEKPIEAITAGVEGAIKTSKEEPAKKPDTEEAKLQADREEAAAWFNRYYGGIVGQNIEADLLFGVLMELRIMKKLAVHQTELLMAMLKKIEEE